MATPQAKSATLAVDDTAETRSSVAPTLNVPDSDAGSETGKPSAQARGDATETSTINGNDDGVTGNAAGEAVAPDEKKNSPPEDADTAANTSEEIVYPSGFKQALLVSATMAGVFLVALDQTIVGTAIPKITDEFGGLSDVAWYGSAYFMTFGAGQPSAGKAFQFFNLKWCFLISIAVFELGSLICGVAPNSTALIIGRAIAGLGGAGMSVGGTSIISFAVPPVKRPMMMGLIGTVYSVAAVLGPILGGVFSDSVSWRWCFYINLPIGGAAAFVILIFFSLPAAAAVPRKTRWLEKLKHVDLVGLSLTMGAIISFVLALQYGGISHAWNSSVVVGLLVGFVAISGALVAWERWLGEYAAMPTRLYKQRSLWSSAIFQFFFFGSYIVLLYYLPIFFQSILGASPIDSGVKNLPLMVPAAVFAIVGGIVVMATGHAQLVMLCSAALTTVAIGLIYTWDLNTTQAQWIGYQFFNGVVMSFGIMHGVTVAQAGSTDADLAAVTANILFFQTIGGAFSTSAGQSAFINRLVAALGTTAPNVPPLVVLATGAAQLRKVFPAEVLPGILEAYMTGLKAAFAVSLAFTGIAFLVSFLVPWGKLPTHGKAGAPMAMA